MDEFPIVQVPSDAAQAPEAMGSKPKFWFRRGDENWLYKRVRLHTGEDWAEKVSGCLCDLIGLPHAEYDLAVWNGVRGVVCRSFVPAGGILIHGNELLFQLIPDYPHKRKGSRSFYRVPQHTVGLVLGVVASPGVGVPPGWNLPAGVESAADVFCGYVMLDAWIGNTDRHHENWALVAQPIEGQRERHSILLAPTFDHASGLACHESDEARRERLQTKDAGRSIDAFVARARSAFYANLDDRQPLTTMEAFREVALRRPLAAGAWVKRLAGVSEEAIESLLRRIPADRMTPVAAEFTSRFLRLNRERLLAAREASS